MHLGINTPTPCIPLLRLHLHWIKNVFRMSMILKVVMFCCRAKPWGSYARWARRSKFATRCKWTLQSSQLLLHRRLATRSPLLSATTPLPKVWLDPGDIRDWQWPFLYINALSAFFNVSTRKNIIVHVESLRVV